MFNKIIIYTILSSATLVHGRPKPKPVIPNTEIDRNYQDFAGIATFAHLPHAPCLNSNIKKFTGDNPLEYDIAIVGIPFDAAVSYRPGARFGPSAIRQASRRYSYEWGWDPNWGFNPFKSWARILDCGDIMPAFSDNAVAIAQMERGYTSLLERPLYNAEWNPSWLKGFPRIMTIGGDHTVLLPILRSLHKKHGPITVIHFDSHIDTWDPEALGGEESKQEGYNHGTILFHAAKEGLLTKSGNLHVGIRNKLTGPENYQTDDVVGFSIITAKSINKIGATGIIQEIKNKVPKDAKIYLSLDIDVIDPAFAPATGTPETGGWSTRELKEILQGLKGLRFVGCDVVEVSPPFDNQAELTSLAAAEVVFDMISLMISNGEEEAGKEEL